MTRRFPIKPAHPERICWGCDHFCPADAMKCGNGSVPTPHPSELFGDDWMTWGLEATPSAPAGDEGTEWPLASQGGSSRHEQVEASTAPCVAAP